MEHPLNKIHCFCVVVFLLLNVSKRNSLFLQCFNAKDYRTMLLLQYAKTNVKTFTHYNQQVANLTTREENCCAYETLIVLSTIVHKMSIAN